jgi:hypothetical protein
MCCVVSGQVGIRRLHPKAAEHSNNLPAMKSAVVDRVKHNLPARHTEDGIVRQDSRQFECQIVVRGSFQPLAVACPKLWPRLNQKFEGMLRSGTTRQALIIHFNETAEPNAFAVMDMAKRPKNTGVRCPQSLIELVHRKRRASFQHLMRSPGGVANMRQQELLELRHKQDCSGAHHSSPQATS